MTTVRIGFCRTDYGARQEQVRASWRGFDARVGR